ncbi:MAG: glycoside hydrolase 100 family protein [Candidatus Falkowbacteria bacterium]
MIIFEDRLIEKCYGQSVELLLRNSHKYGTAAALPTDKAKHNLYTNIFGRDASICALGMVASGDKKLLDIARTNLLTLARYQTKSGQIPSSVDPVKDKKFFYFLGSIDSTLWWLVAIDFYDRHAGDKALKSGLSVCIKKALTWLFYQDTNADGLLEQSEASDWADNMPANGRTLYTNVLWYRALERFGFDREKKLASDGLNALFRPHEASTKRSLFFSQDRFHRLVELRIMKKLTDNVPYYLHYIGHKNASDRCDVYANALAILFGVASPARAKAIVRWFRDKKISRKYPAIALYPPIERKDYDWRPYLDEENKPYNYHNGGIWPFVGAFYVMALRKTGHLDPARKELARLAEANRINNWQFNEWFQGKTGKPMGMHGQSWNAATFLLAYHYLKGDIDW